MDEREKLSYEEKIATAHNSRDSAKMEILENGSWTNVETIQQNGQLDETQDATIMSYSTNREKVYHKNAGTIEEIHVLESSGRTTKDFVEEHWSSKIKSYVVPQPPKFIQVIKAFRVLTTDTLTLVVEVQSDPPAIFEWFCNDKPMQQNRRKFKARHGINITTLTVVGPEQGVYKCTAKNPVGTSTTYGYVTVNAPLPYKTWFELTNEVNEEAKMEIDEKQNIQTSSDIPPKFIQQIPNLTLRPGTEAIIDVEVEASPPAKFTWYMNGVQFSDTAGQIEIYYPITNRCVVRFLIPQKGEYKVIAENRAGKEQSVGYIDIKNEVTYYQKQLPPIPNGQMYHSSYAESDHHVIPLQQGQGRASSISRIVDYYEETSCYQRSTSLPRHIGQPYEIKKATEIIGKLNDDSKQQKRQYLSTKELVETEETQLRSSKRRRYSETTQLPEKPFFTSKLPLEISVCSNEDLVLSVGFKAFPRANVKWNVNGFELKDSQQVTIMNEEYHSTLIVRPPIRYGRYGITISNEYGMCNQTTRVHYSDEEQYEEVKESHLLTNGITENPMTTCTTTTLFDGWELIDKQQGFGRSTGSFETVRAATEGYEASTCDGTPTPRQSFHSSTYTLRQHEDNIGGRSAVSYEALTNASQPKPIIPVIHQPLRGMNVSIVSEVSHASPYTDNRCETFAEERYERAIRAKSETDRVPPLEPQLQKEIIDHKIVEEKTFRIPVRHVMQPIPKHPLILKQLEPEIRLKAGEKLVLESKVDSSPASQFHWYQNNFEVRPSSSVIIESPEINESRATFLKPVSGTYKMVASNVHGSCSSTTRVITDITEEWITESTISVTRAVPEMQEPKYQLVSRSHNGTRNDLPKVPRIVEGFEPVLRIASDESLVLRVTADAIPEANFRWMLNNFEVRANQAVDIQHPGPNISQATFHNPISGRYEVIAINSLGQDSCSGKVIVDYAKEAQVPSFQPVNRPVVPKVPVFIKPLPGETRLYPDEQEYRLSVLVQGEQPITFRWFADGSLLSNSIEHQMINDLESSTLVVRKEIGFDVDYAVEVSNANGAAWSETTVKPASSSASLVTNATSAESTQLEINEVQQYSPRYTILLVDLDLQQNDEFTAHVVVNAQCSPCEFTWTLDGHDVRTIPGFRVESTFFESTLYVKSAVSKHSGELSVVASNKYGTAKSTAKITVHPLLEESYEFVSEVETIPAERPPRIISPLQPSVFRSGESLELHCLIDGLPRPEVFWTRNGIPVDNKVVEKEVITTQYSDGRCVLINPKCSSEDAGLYQLTARNIHGVANTSAYISIERDETMETVTTETRNEFQVIHRTALEPQLSMIVAKQDKHDMIVRCKVISETPTVVSWYKDGERLYPSYKYRIEKLPDNTYTLTICNVDKFDEGSYSCSAENMHGISETGICIRPLIEEIPKEIPIEGSDSEVIGLEDNIGYAKKKYTDTAIKLLVEPEISDSQEVYSHTAELRKTEVEYKLLVKVAEFVASKLVAKVIMDDAIREAIKRMNVEEIPSSDEEEFDSTCERHPRPPRFETNIECYTVDAGDAVVLHTDINGYPEPNIEWYFGGQKLEQSEQIEVKYVNKQAILTIKKVEREHEGTYYCHAENEYGKAVLPCYIRITTAQDWSESEHKITRPSLTYTSSENETEVSSNVHVTHAEELYDHYFSSIQPETFALGYSCLASTSKVCDDSVIITRESMQKMIEKEQEAMKVMLNVNVERTPVVFKHDGLLLRTNDESVNISAREPQYTREEEVIQTNNIILVGDQRVLQQHQSVVNAIATVVFENPLQQASTEFIVLYSEKACINKEKIQAVGTVVLQKTEIVNELIGIIIATEEKFREAYAEANVDVRCPDAMFDHFITVVESEHEHLRTHLVAPVHVTNFATSDMHLQQKPESLHAETVSIEYPRRNASAEQRIVILQSPFQNFTDAITWNLKKVYKEAGDSGITVAHANIKVYKPEEIGEYATTIIDRRTVVPEFLAIASAASKHKLTSIFVTLTKKGDVAHQALVIEYQSLVEDEASLNVAMLTVPRFHSKQESVWPYERKHKKLEETEADVVAIFVDVSATSPNQTIELIASVNLPPSAPGIPDITQSSQPYYEQLSTSWSESSSTGLLQVPKFIKPLENATAVVGQFHQFKCIISGTPVPLIRWYVDGDAIHDSDIYQTVYEDGVCILKIREVAIEDEGEYTCEAISDAGRAVTKCFLQTIAEDDILKYQQQAILENIYYSNNGTKNNNYNDNYSFSADISLDRNVDEIIYQNQTANYNDSIGQNDKDRKQFLTVNYEFVRNEPIGAETKVVVIHHITSQEGLNKSLASEERSFNVAIWRPNAAMECSFIWALENYATVELHLILPYQFVDFVIQNILPQQSEEAYLILNMKKLTLANISFAIYQPWEEILLLKKSEYAFAWDSNFCPIEKAALAISAMENVATGTVADDVRESNIANITVLTNPTPEIAENFNKSENPPIEQNGEVISCRDEELKVPKIPITDQKIACKENEIDADILERNVDNKLKNELFEPISEEHSESGNSALAAIHRYAADLVLNLDSVIPTASSYKQSDTDKSNVINSEMDNDLFKHIVNDEYLNCSFYRKLENIETIRDLPESRLTSANIHLAENVLPLPRTNSNPNFKNIICYSDDNLRQTFGNPRNKESYSEIDTWTMDSTLDSEQLTDLTTDTYSLLFTNPIKGADTATVDVSDEFEVFSALADSTLHYDKSSCPRSICTSERVLVDHSKSYILNPGIFEALNNRISAKKSLSEHDISTNESLSKMRVIDEPCGDNIEHENKLNDNEEALQIERAIYDISERIEHQHSVTEAQAEASEELLKTILEDIIKNTGKSSVIETIAAYKKPVVLLREKLTDLEETLLEFKESSMRRSVMEAQRRFSKSFSTEDEFAKLIERNSIEKEIRGVSSCDLRQTASTSNREIERMTPLTSNIKEKLESLEHMLEEVEKGDDIEELNAGIQANLSIYSDAKRHEVHNILIQINNEIGIIKRRCQRNISKASVDIAVRLLHKVRNNVSSIADLISVYGKKLRKKSHVEKGANVSKERTKSSKQPLLPSSPCSKTGFFFKTDASVNFYFIKREQSEVINAIVNFYNKSDKYADQVTKNENYGASACDDTVFDKNEILQRTENNLQQISGPIDLQNNSFSIQSVQESQAVPTELFQKSREMSERRAFSQSLIPLLPMIRRSKSCDDYKNFFSPSSILVPKQKFKKLSEVCINHEKIIEKEGKICSCLYLWPVKEEYHTALETFDESNSMQLICEDSDYAPEPVVHLPLPFEPTKNIQEETKDELLKAFLSDLNTSKIEAVTKSNENFAVLKDAIETKKSITPELDENYNENSSECLVDVGEKINESSKSIENPRNSTSEDAVIENVQNAETKHYQVYSDTESQIAPQFTGPFEDEANSLHEIESIVDKDEIFDELDDLMIICNSHANINDGVDSLQQAVEDCEKSKNGNSFMSVSTNTVIAKNEISEASDILEDVPEIISEHGKEKDKTASSTLQLSKELTGKILQVPADESNMDVVKYLNKQKVILTCESDAEQVSEKSAVNVNCKKLSDKLKVLAVLSPEIRAKSETCTVTGDFDVLVEQLDEAQNFTAKILDHISDSISLDLTLPNIVEVALSSKHSCESISPCQVENSTDGAVEKELKNIESDNDHHRRQLCKSNRDKEIRTGISVSVIARSMYDVAHASIEEIPWSEESMRIVMQPIMTRSKTDSETRNSLIQNVTVSESHETEKRSLRSHESFRSSSQQSFDWSEFGDRSFGGQNLNVPTYIVKEGSTATITCEFNNFLIPGSLIEWFKGKTLMHIVSGKTDRISHDLLEVLVISQVNQMDADVYSIKVNDIIYPVACLIIENADASSEKFDDDIHFISPPQTLFVMEGQPSIICCQVNSADQKIEWCKDNKKMLTENERIRLEADQFGYHRIIIDKSELEDQGTYYAVLGDHFTTVTLVVEERIDEREVTISALGTDTEEDDYHEYLVPLGSTATIACELEDTDEVQKLVWYKDGKRIEFSDDEKIEHVVNGLKHYLVIHNTEANDSASYSVCINDIEFKIAHLMISSLSTASSNIYTKRISRSSLH